jgi:hypothetical protein
MRPQPNTYPPYFEKYIASIKEDKVIEALQGNLNYIKKFVAEIPQEKENFAYADGKWTVKQVIQHTIDTERILSYRALRFARKDPQQLLSFDENLYVANTDLSNYSLTNLITEFETVRAATLSLYKSFSAQTLLNMGNLSIGQVSVLAIGFFICGHNQHHLNVIKERYL